MEKMFKFLQKILQKYDRYNFWPKLATMTINAENFNLEFQLFQKTFRLDKMERHYKSEEFMTPLTGPIIIHLQNIKVWMMMKFQTLTK